MCLSLLPAGPPDQQVATCECCQLLPLQGRTRDESPPAPHLQEHRSTGFCCTAKSPLRVRWGMRYPCAPNKSTPGPTTTADLQRGRVLALHARLAPAGWRWRRKRLLSWQPRLPGGPIAGASIRDHIDGHVRGTLAPPPPQKRSTRHAGERRAVAPWAPPPPVAGCESSSDRVFCDCERLMAPWRSLRGKRQELLSVGSVQSPRRRLQLKPQGRRCHPRP